MDDENKPNPEANEILSIDVIPEWHEELVKKELQNIADGNAGLMEWSEVKKILTP